MRFQKNYVYVDDDVFGFTIDATKYLEEACLQYGYRYYRGKKIEGVKK